MIAKYTMTVLFFILLIYLLIREFKGDPPAYVYYDGEVSNYDDINEYGYKPSPYKEGMVNGYSNNIK